MNFWEFIVGIVHYIAWPIAALIILYWFRENLANMLKRRIKYTAGQHSIEILEEMNKEIPQIDMGNASEKSRLDLVERIAYDNILVIMLLDIASEQPPNSQDFHKRAMETLAMALGELEAKRPDSDMIPIINGLNSKT